MAALPTFKLTLLLGLPALAAQTSLVTRPGGGFADSRLCAGCHRDIAANYARTGMGRSFFTPGAANTIEDYRKAPE